MGVTCSVNLALIIYIHNHFYADDFRQGNLVHLSENRAEKQAKKEKPFL
jgi:hypothetical protein